MQSLELQRLVGLSGRVPIARSDSALVYALGSAVVVKSGEGAHETHTFLRQHTNEVGDKQVVNAVTSCGGGTTAGAWRQATVV